MRGKANLNSNKQFPGGSREIGTALTRLCLRQRAIEQRTRDLAHRLSADTTTFNAKVTDIRQTAVSLDKQHERVCTKQRMMINKRQADVARVDKKMKGAGGEQRHFRTIK